MTKLCDDLLSVAKSLPDDDAKRALLFRAAGEIDGLREQLNALRDAIHVIDKAVRNPDTINALARRNT